MVDAGDDGGEYNNIVYSFPSMGELLDAIRNTFMNMDTIGESLQEINEDTENISEDEYYSEANAVEPMQEYVNEQDNNIGHVIISEITNNVSRPIRSISAPTSISESVALESEDSEEYNEILNNISGAILYRDDHNKCISLDIDTLFDIYKDHPTVRAIRRDSHPLNTNINITLDDIYDPNDNLRITLAHGHYHRYYYKCNCRLCDTVTHVSINIITKKYICYRLPYLDAAFEEIFKYGSWTNDGILWNTNYDELMDAMTTYYPGYGCSAAEVYPGRFYVCIHPLPIFYTMQVSANIISSTNYIEHESIDDIDNDIPSLIPIIND